MAASERRESRLRQALRLEPERDVLEDREPRKDRKALEHHGDAVRRTRDRLAQIGAAPGARMRQAGDQPQQRGLARSGAPQQTDDLAFIHARLTPRAPAAHRRRTSERSCGRRWTSSNAVVFMDSSRQASRNLRSA